MKKIFSLFVFIFVCLTINSQAPESFRYQALLKSSDGSPRASVAVVVKIDILKGSTTGTSVYTESHNVTTTSTGLINLDLGGGTPSNGTFAAIDWSAGPYFVQITVDGTLMGTSQLLSVPYSLYSKKAGNGFSGNYADLTNKPDLTVGSVKKMTVTGETTNMEEALFEVKNKSGQTVFAVYSEGVRIYVSDGAKGAKGGFAIGGFTSGKAAPQDYLVVSPDSIKMYIDATPGKAAKGGFSLGGFSGAKNPLQDYLVINPDLIRMYIDATPGKGSKGGFSLGGFTTAKTTSVQDLLIVNPDSIRAYIDYNSGGKGAKGGFAIGGFTGAKGPGDEYLRVTRDSTRIYINNTPAKAAKGGFAIGGFTSSKGGGADYFSIDPDSINVYVRTNGSGSSSTFNILSLDEDLNQKPLLRANADTIDMKSVLNLENNFTVLGNIGYTGTSTKINVPTIGTLEPSNVTQISANTGGDITDNGGAAIIASGVVWGIAPNPTIALTTKTTDGSATGSFTSSITGLTASTTYYVRAYATNSAGTGYGNSFGFTTTSGGATVNDIDGNSYNIVTIGTQTWMASNLKTTKFNDGSAIPMVTGTTEWGAPGNPAYTWYDNDAASYQGTNYGALYNFDAVSQGNLCPVGWHVPTESEGQTLTTFLGGDPVAGGKLKEIGLTHWSSPNTGATDEVGFTALPGGLRNYMGMFMNIGTSANWWSSSALDTQNALFLSLNTNTADAVRSMTFKQFGMSVRCMQGPMPTITIPTVTTSAFTPSYFDAIGGGEVTSDGGAPVFERGVCYSLNPNPTINDFKTFDGSGTGVYVSNLVSLSMVTTYYIRAYATNSAGTAYGAEVTITTLLSK